MDNVFPHSFFLTAEDMEPEPIAPCGCEWQDCTPAYHPQLGSATEVQHYCQACDNDLPGGSETIEK